MTADMNHWFHSPAVTHRSRIITDPQNNKERVFLQIKLLSSRTSNKKKTLIRAGAETNLSRKKFYMQDRSSLWGLWKQKDIIFFPLSFPWLKYLHCGHRNIVHTTKGQDVKDGKRSVTAWQERRERKEQVMKFPGWSLLQRVNSSCRCVRR